MSAAAFPITIDCAAPQGADRRSITVDAQRDGERVRVSVRVSLDGELWSVQEDHIDGESAAVGLPTLAAWVTENLGRLSEHSAPSPHGVTLRPAPYLPPPRSTVIALVDSILEQSGSRGFDWRFVVLEGWPEPPRAVYFASHAQAMLGGGAEAYLSTVDPNELDGILGTLDLLGCFELVALLEAALRLAADTGSDTVDADALLSLGIADGPRPADWAEVDRDLQPLLTGELATALAAYIEDHADILFDRSPREP